MANSQPPKVALNRVDALCPAHNSHGIHKIMTFFVEDGLDYSDYGLISRHGECIPIITMSLGLNALHMPASAVRQTFSGLYDCIADSIITTRSVSGTESFAAWELDLEGQYIKDYPTTPKAAGQTLKLVGISLRWWNENGKVWNECDYVSMKLVGADGSEKKFH